MKNFLKSKRGFSLVELMVVVAIMGTLATIAIPAYNEYRKSAKKTAYRTDMLSLHKGWLAFGVELDSFCERETSPANSTINNVGMASLLNSKLYGKGGGTIVTAADCQCGCTVSGNTCTGNQNNNTGCTQGNPCATSHFIPAIMGNGPSKHNFIGFGDDNCSNASLSDRQILGDQGSGNNTTHDSDCDLNTSSYEMGVYGHISGKEYFGVSVNNNGVVSGEASVTNSTQIPTADSSCS